MKDTASYCNFFNEEVKGLSLEVNFRAPLLHIRSHTSFADCFPWKQTPLQVTQCHQCQPYPQNIYTLKKKGSSNICVSFECSSIIITIMEVCSKKRHWAWERGRQVIFARQYEGWASSVPPACKRIQSPKNEERKNSSSTSIYCLSVTMW